MGQERNVPSGLAGKMAWLAGYLTMLAAVCPVERSTAAEHLVRDADRFHERIADAQPGDVLVLARGTWHDVDLVAKAEGTAERPITVRAEEPGQVTLTGNSRLRIGGSYLVVEGLRFSKAWHRSAIVEFRRDSKLAANHCRLTQCEISDCEPPDPSIDFKYLSLYGSRNRVDHCRFGGKTNGGTTVVVWLNPDKEGWGGHKIDQNHFARRPPLGRNGGETLRIGDSRTAHLRARTLVEANLFEECDGESEIISNKSCENLYRGNLFLRCSGALTLRHGHRCRVEGNLFLGEKARGTGGVRIVGQDHVVVNNYFERLEGDDLRSALCVMNGIRDSPASGYDPVERLIVAHNSFVDCKRTWLIGRENDADDQVSPTDCLFANNVITSRRGPMIDLRAPSSEAGKAPVGWLGNRFAGKGVLGIDPCPGVEPLDTDPLVKGDHRWILVSGSPLIDSGVTLPGLARFDLEGKERDKRPDIGCDESPSADRDPRSRTVGPSWLVEP